jgi:hypothetical protein
MRIIVAAAALTFLAAGEAASAAAVSKSNILTAKHVAVSGTHIAVVPPQGAIPSSSFIGFELPSQNITYRIVERINVPFNESAGFLTAEGLAADGIELVESSPVILNGKRAMLISGRAVPKEAESSSSTEGSGEEMGVLLFALGDDRLTVLMYGHYPMSDRSAVVLLRNSMLSTILKQGQSAGSGGYSLSTAGTALAFADEASSTRYYTVGGVSMQDGIKSAIYTASRSSQDVLEEQRPAFADNAMAMYLSAYEFSISGRGEISFAGLKGLEIVADFDGEPRKIRTASGGRTKRKAHGKGYLAVLFGDGVVYTFSGMAVINAESYLQQFRKITSTFAILK